MTESLEREIRTLRELYWSDRDPDGRVFATLADAYRRSGEIRQALELLEEGRERLPDFPSGHVVAARLYCDAGMMEEASLAARRALELDEENVEALRSLARSVEARGEVLEAARLRSRATELESTRGGEAGQAPAEPAEEEPDEPAVDEEPVALDELEPDEPAEAVDSAEEEPVFSLDDLAPDEEEPVALDELAPAVDEEPVALDELEPDEPAEAVDSAEEEPVFSLDDLAPDEEEEPVALDELAPAVDEEPVALDALAPDEPAEAVDSAEEEPVFSLDALAPDEDQDPVALDELAPDGSAEAVDSAEEEPVFSLDDLAPDEEEAVGLEASAAAPEELAAFPRPDAPGGGPARSGSEGEGPLEASEAELPAPSASSDDGSRAASTGEGEEEPAPHDPLPTRTLADLYARQGLLERALSVYRRLLLVTPGDVELQRRIEALTAEQAEAREPREQGARESTEGDVTEGPAIAELGLDRDEQSSGSDLDTPFAWTEETDTRGSRDRESPISDYFSRMLSWGGGESADGGEASP